jgi:hypothetical protein
MARIISRNAQQRSDAMAPPSSPRSISLIQGCGKGLGGGEARVYRRNRENRRHDDGQLRDSDPEQHCEVHNVIRPLDHFEIGLTRISRKSNELHDIQRSTSPEF